MNFYLPQPQGGPGVCDLLHCGNNFCSDKESPCRIESKYMTLFFFCLGITTIQGVGESKFIIYSTFCRCIMFAKRIIKFRNIPLQVKYTIALKTKLSIVFNNELKDITSKNCVVSTIFQKWNTSGFFETLILLYNNIILLNNSKTLEYVF